MSEIKVGDTVRFTTDAGKRNYGTGTFKVISVRGWEIIIAGKCAPDALSKSDLRYYAHSMEIEKLPDVEPAG